MFREGVAMTIIFRLKRLWKIENKTVDLYAEIKDGRKTSEWRDATDYWIVRLTTLAPLKNLDRCSRKELLEWANMPLDTAAAEDAGITLTEKLKARDAWLIFGGYSSNVPRFEVDITDLILYPREGQFEIKFTNVREVI
jgi:hypothetical protein